jgi:hypothetical protein
MLLSSSRVVLQEHVSGVKLQRIVNMAATGKLLKEDLARRFNHRVSSGATLMGPWSFTQVRCDRNSQNNHPVLLLR